MRSSLRNRLLAGLITAAVAFAVAVILSPRALAQQAGAPAAPTPQTAAPIDITGVWVSIVTEEWRWRMMTPPKGDYATIPMTDDARRLADTWDPAKDTADGNACRGYGAVGIMRLPARFRVSWQDPNTLKMEIDAGQQTRLFRFGSDQSRPAGNTDWQGYSVAKWLGPGGVDPALNAGRGGGGGGGFGQVGGAPPVAPAGRGRGAAAGGAPPPVQRGGSLHVETANMKPGYIRKNGVPYSESATMVEYFVTNRTPDGNQWLTVTQLVRDPKYIQGEYVTNWHYRKEPDSSKWRPTPCSAA